MCVYIYVYTHIAGGQRASQAMVASNSTKNPRRGSQRGPAGGGRRESEEAAVPVLPRIDTTRNAKGCGYRGGEHEIGSRAGTAM